MNEKLISTFYSNDSFKKAEILINEDEKFYIIKLYESIIPTGTTLIDIKEFPGYSLKQIEDMAEDYVLF